MIQAVAACMPGRCKLQVQQELSSKTTKLAGVCLCVCVCACVRVSAKHFKITTQKNVSILSSGKRIIIVQQPSTERGIEGYTMFYWLFGIS